MGRPKTGSLYFSGETWKARITLPDGSRRNFDLGTNVLSEAERKKKKLNADIKRGADLSWASEQAAISDCFEDYAKRLNETRKTRGIVSARDEIQRMRDYVFPYIGKLPLDAIRPRHVRDVLDKAVEKGLSSQTVRHIRNAMYKVFRVAVVDELVPDNVVEKVDSPSVEEAEKERVALTDDEFVRLWRYLISVLAEEMRDEERPVLPTRLRNRRVQEASEFWGPHVAACLEAGGDHVAYAKKNGLRSDVLLIWMRRARETQSAEVARSYVRLSPAREMLTMSACARVLGGMRTSDLINWDWVMFDPPHFFNTIIPRKKTKKPQALRIPESLRPIVRNWWERSGTPTSGPVFPVLRGSRRGQKRASRGVSYAARLRAACKAAGLTRKELYVETEYTLPVDFHSLRAAFVTAGRRAGVDIELSKRLANHENSDIHRGYYRDDPVFRTIPEAMIPEIPLLPDASDDPQRPVENCHGPGETSLIQSKSSRATQESNLPPSAPEAEGVAPSDPLTIGNDPEIGPDVGPRETTADHDGPGFRLVLPSGSSEHDADHNGPRVRVPPHQSERAGQRLERALVVTLNGGAGAEAEVAALLGEACSDLGLCGAS